MTRKRNQPIVLSNERNIEWMKENLGRRRMLQILGAAGATSLAGCGGGGGGEETPTATATEPAGQETPTPTPTEADDAGMETTEAKDTPTPTATPGETVETPTGEVEVSDVIIQDTTFSNLEKFQVNDWNAESGFIPGWQTMDLAHIPSTALPASPTFEGAVRVTMHTLAKKMELDPQSNVWTMTLRDGIKWGSGQEFIAQHVLDHAEILRTQVELGEQGESTLPISMEIIDDKTIESQLVPGNPMLRYLEALFQGGLGNVYETHPVHHRSFVESLKSATSNPERKKELQKLFSATLSADKVPDFAVGPFIVDNWNPNRMIFKSRTDFPWGFDLSPALEGFDIDKIHGGIKMVSIGEEQTNLNAAVGGKRDFVRLPNKRAFQRLQQSNSAWAMYEAVESSSAALYFSPLTPFGKQTEKARQMRQAVAYFFDNEEVAAINDLVPAYESSTGFVAEDYFEAWIGSDRFLENWSNYGHRDTGYSFPDKGEQKMQQAGFSKNKNGFWVDGGSGEPATLNTIAQIRWRERVWGMTRPVIENVVEQFNEAGFRSKAMIKQSEDLENMVQNFEGWDIAFLSQQTEVNPHPFFGFREDTGLGSREGMPVSISSWDWRNGYRRVEVPMPVGDPDGPLTQMDFDKLVKEMVQIEDHEEMKTRVRTLSWILNQWMPGVFVIGLLVLSALNTDVLEPQPSVEEYPGWLNDESGAGGPHLHASGYLQPP